MASRERINKEEHAAIYEAVAAWDIEGARESMRRHISKAMARLGLTGLITPFRRMRRALGPGARGIG